MTNKEKVVAASLIIMGIVFGFLTYTFTDVSSRLIVQMVPAAGVMKYFMIIYISIMVVTFLISYLIIDKTFDRTFYPFRYKLLYIVFFIAMVAYMYWKYFKW